MLLKKLSVALCLVGLPLTSFAAALDRSGQSIAGFLQPNNYFEAGISVLDPNVSGQDVAGGQRVSGSEATLASSAEAATASAASSRAYWAIRP